MRIVAATTVLLGLAAAAGAQTQEYNGIPTQRRAAVADAVIVKWREGSSSAAAASLHRRVGRLASKTGRKLHPKQQISPTTDVVNLERTLGGGELQAVLAEIAADPDVEFAVANQRRWPHAVPSDPLFVSEQWYFQSTEIAATRADQAWDVTPGSNTTVVAVLDTGVRFDHEDLRPLAQGGKLLPGFDFISSVPTANDGNGIDPDASDPGDWVSAADAQQPPFAGNDCIPEGQDHVDSSWHGTRVSSLIAAVTNNAAGMAGGGWDTLLLPVRVLGKCGGYDSDIIAGMRWAAGLNVPGVPLNPTPARILNLSLGAAGACSAAYQSAINELTARGVLVVASVGNEGGPVSSPANCNGVLGVTGLRHAGTKVGFSNLGLHADIGAPAGNCVNTGPGQPCVYSIVAATNTGDTTPAINTYTDRFNFNVGTSFASPLVAGAAALMHAVNDRLSSAQYIALLQQTATPFPTSSTTTTTVCQPPGLGTQAQECICTTQTCGAGMLNTHAAVLAAQRPFAIAQAPTQIDANTDVTIDARTSFAANGRTIASYRWSAVGVTGASPVFADAAQPLTTFQVPGTTQFTLRLTVTDDHGSEDTADVPVSTASSDPPPGNPPPTNPAPPTAAPNSGGGGGGDMGALMLTLFALAFLRARPEVKPRQA